jgi:hypothetical protein
MSREFEGGRIWGLFDPLDAGCRWFFGSMDLRRIGFGTAEYNDSATVLAIKSGVRLVSA